jgi:hypothetical protein
MTPRWGLSPKGYYYYRNAMVLKYNPEEPVLSLPKRGDIFK